MRGGLVLTITVPCGRASGFVTCVASAATRRSVFFFMVELDLRIAQCVSAGSV